MLRLETFWTELRTYASVPIAVASLVVVATCSSGAVQPSARPTKGKPATTAVAAPAVSQQAPATKASKAGALAPDSSAPKAEQPSGPPDRLQPLWDALSALEKGEQDKVRIVWLGDSHAAADIWTGAVRSALQERFGAGGPGYVRLGYQPYRHDQARLGRTGAWRREPRQPAKRMRDDDGVFGLGGARMTPKAAHSTATAKLESDAAEGPVSWQLLYRLNGGKLLVELGDRSKALSAASSGDKIDGSPILRTTLEGQPEDVLTVRHQSGAPELFGAIVETKAPGVVVDTSGVDGARAATPLAWEPQQFAAEVAARKPALVVAAYGTNEVFDERNPEAYTEQLVELMKRVRSRASDAACLIVGPPDAADASWTSHPRVAAITAAQRRAADEVGCAFISAAEIMGGSGAFAEWANQKPALAKRDRVHLTAEGYRRLGKAIAERLLSGYADR